ncbi:MAG: histidinol-phosphatase, partial [Flavobacteriaceae bacterium]|nr:histidinol-phosphatase [Flavobacteriaceae bacterium]
MKKVLFIDRDGTLIRETEDEQIDSFDKLIFYPKALLYMSKIANELNFSLVMITNQDGLGTKVFPENTFWPVHDFIIKTFENEDVVFDKQFIDRSFAKDNSPNRKPNTGLLNKYFTTDYDLQKSFVIGDRLTDMELAKNLNSKGIFINDNTNLGSDEISIDQIKLDE